jgi:hypothetical protein
MTQLFGSHLTGIRSNSGADAGINGGAAAAAARRGV